MPPPPWAVREETSRSNVCWWAQAFQKMDVPSCGSGNDCTQQGETARAAERQKAKGLWQGVKPHGKKGEVVL